MKVVQDAAEQLAGPATYVGATGTVIWGLTADEWTAIGVIVGVVFTLATFCLNWYYRHKSWKHLRTR